MKDSHGPVFANTCGKLYNDYIILASSHSERTLPITSVKKITLVKSVALNSALFMAVPLMLLTLPRVIEDPDDVVLKIMLYALGVISLLAGIMTTKINYAVKIRTVNNSVLKVNLIEENKKESKKFVDAAKKLIFHAKAIKKAELSEQRTAENIYNTANVIAGQ